MLIWRRWRRSEEDCNPILKGEMRALNDNDYDDDDDLCYPTSKYPVGPLLLALATCQVFLKVHAASPT